MKICVVASGVPHAVPRTLAFSQYFEEIHFIDVSGKADSHQLTEAKIRYWGPEEFDFNYSGLQQLFEQLQPELIICHFCSGPHFFGAIAYGQCPVAGIVMGSDLLYQQGDKKNPTLWPWLIRMGIRRLSYISAKSRYLEQKCRDLNVPAPVAVNYWGSDLKIFVSSSKVEACSATGLPEDRFVILSPRTLSPLYNIESVVLSMPAIIEQVPTALLIILGREQPEYRRYIDNLIGDLGLHDHVRIVGEVGADKIVDYYNSSDVVVSMARSEGFPNTVLEVLSCRRPLVIGRLKQLEEVLVDGQDCLMTQIDPPDIAAAILKIFAQPELTSEIVAAGYIKAIAHGDIWRNGKQFAEDIKRIALATNPGFRNKPGVFFYRLVFLLFRIQKKLIGR